MAQTCSAPVMLLKHRETSIHLAHADLPFAAFSMPPVVHVSRGPTGALIFGARVDDHYPHGAGGPGFRGCPGSSCRGCPDGRVFRVVRAGRRKPAAFSVGRRGQVCSRPAISAGTDGAFVRINPAPYGADASVDWPRDGCEHTQVLSVRRLGSGQCRRFPVRLPADGPQPAEYEQQDPLGGADAERWPAADYHRAIWVPAGLSCVRSFPPTPCQLRSTRASSTYRYPDAGISRCSGCTAAQPSTCSTRPETESGQLDRCGCGHGRTASGRRGGG